jgi:hypothetical protein
MPVLFPPDYPERLDAPLLSFGPAFAEEIARSVAQAVYYENREQPQEAEVRVAAALTMLEAFHPRDHLETMFAAQGVGIHTALMESLRRAMHPDTSETLAIKLRTNVAQLSRSFSVLVRDLERRQSKPLPPRPVPVTPAPGGPGPETGESPPAAADDDADLPDDVATRPDGSPGSLDFYLPKAPEEEFVPGEPPIMMALATRPKPWRIVEKGATPPPGAQPVPQAPDPGRGPLDLAGRTFTGDDWASFASARAGPGETSDQIPDEESLVELELISTGGDADAEAERAALQAAHPEGRAVKILRHGRRRGRTEE